MSGRLSGQLAGSVRWAIAPYAPAPPFRLYAAGREPYEFTDPEQLIQASRKGGDAELIYLVAAKSRPVLILTEPERSEWSEVLALRLRRFSAINDSEKQQLIRDHRDPLHFYLEPGRFDLPEENAALISALVPISVEAISGGPPLGVVNDNEMRVIGERLIRHFDFDVRLLVEQRIRELARRQQQR